MRPVRSSFACRAVGAAIAAAASASGASAQTPPQSVVVTAARVPQRVSDVIAEVTVLDRAALDRAEGRTLAELLAQQPGLQFASNGGLGKTSSVFIRGLEARHTLLLVDGVRVQSSTVGAPSFDNLPLESIERIEIVRGPMSSLYGSGALGGVIQVFTRKGGAGWSANGKLAAGSHGLRQASAGLGFGEGAFDGAVQAQYTDVKGISATNPRVPFGSYNDDRDGFRQSGGSVKLGLNLPAAWRVELLALQARGLTRLDDGPGADARARLENSVTSLALSGQPLAGWHTRIAVAGASDGYDTLASASPFAELGETRSRLRQATWENRIDTAIGSVLALAERSKEKVSRPGQPYDVSERDIDAATLGWSGSAAAHSWQASVRRDRNSQFGGATTGAAGYGYAFSPAWRAAASYGTSFVVPSFNLLYYPGFSNPLLQPEEGRHGELSLRWTQGEHSLRGALYRYRYRGFITAGPQPTNLPRAEIDGITLSYEGRWRDLDLAASIDHTDPRNATAGNANHDKLLPRRARDQLRLAADWQGGAWTAGATLGAFSHRFDDAANATRLGGYATLDLRADWTLRPGLTLGAKLNNALGKTYETTLGYNQPGREGFLTLRWALR